MGMILVGVMAGCSGDSGSGGTTDGTDGSTASDGNTASDGTSAADGLDGATAIDATDGATGTDATDGSTGSDGTAGNTGTDGTDGSTGSDGTDGTTGSDGTDGSTGSDGTDGSDGSDGPGHPCDAETLPTGDLLDCACEADEFCCEDWDWQCVETAGEVCGLECSCDDIVASCETHADCLPCDVDQDICTGGFQCDAGKCIASEPITCTGMANGCIVDTCHPETGACGSAPDDAGCDDQLACTNDACKDDGTCINAPLEGCGDNSPCKTATTPTSSDPTITACTCEADAFCCTDSWDPTCVSKAKSACGLVCDCATQPPSELACETDDDCSWCGILTTCGGGFVCQDSVCTAKPGITCDSSGDSGCMVNTCVEETGGCEPKPQVTACEDDGDECTTTLCSETGTCSHEPIEFCGVTSCQDRCDNYTSSALCQCDEFCESEGDCCEDFCPLCGVDFPEICGG